MRQLIAALLLVLAGPALAQTPAAPASQPAAQKLTLLLDWYVNPDHGPIVIAKEKGYFADEGLDVTIVPPADAATPSKLVAAGQADIAVSYQQQLHLQVAEGLPLLRVGTLIATPLNCLMTLKDGPIATIADLKGRKIGFSVAGVEEALLTTMLARHGLTLADVELVNVNFALVQSLMSRQVDAVIGAFRNIELNQMKANGVEGKCAYVEEEGIPPYDELIFVANSRTMDRAKIAKFLAAVERGTQFIVNHPQESWKIFSGTATELQDEANEMAWKDTIARFALRPAALDEGRYARYEQFLKDSGLIETVKPVSELAIDVTAR